MPGDSSSWASFLVEPMLACAHGGFLCTGSGDQSLNQGSATSLAVWPWASKHSSAQMFCSHLVCKAYLIIPCTLVGYWKKNQWGKVSKAQYQGPDLQTQEPMLWWWRFYTSERSSIKPDLERCFTYPKALRNYLPKQTQFLF